MTDKEKDMKENNQNDGDSSSDVTRRRFLTATFAGATTIGLVALAAPLGRYAYPVLKGEVYEKLSVASVAQLSPLSDGVNFDYQDMPAQLIQLEDGGYAAYSLICPHLGCIVKWVSRDGLFECPCHAAKFNPDGSVAGGPPPKGLTKLKVAIEGNDIFVEGVEPEEKD